jgi:hypothetical protein
MRRMDKRQIRCHVPPATSDMRLGRSRPLGMQGSKLNLNLARKSLKALISNLGGKSSQGDGKRVKRVAYGGFYRSVASETRRRLEEVLVG